jgi:putative addiction module component (TIGR02574 family)
MNSADKALEALRALPIDERIQLVEDLWDTIAEETEAGEFELSPELAAELDRRLDEYRRDPSSARPAEEVLARLRRLIASDR